MNVGNNTASVAPETTDQRAERKYWFWLALHAVAVLPAFLGFSIVIAISQVLHMSEANGMILGFGVAALFLTIGTLTAWLQSHHWIGWLFRDVRSRALIGAERLARDDDQLMLEGIREVVFEWHHIDDLLRERDLSAMLLSIATGFVTIIVFLVAPWIVRWMVHLQIVSAVPTWAVATFMVLATLYSASGFVLSWSIFRSKCFSETDYNPTTVIQERVLALLTEVKALRRTGVIT